MAVTLILFGAFWIFSATAVPMAMRVRAMSDAAQLESNLHAWASEKVQTGKLQDTDVKEIFPEGYALRMGGEDPSKSFREMISDIAVSSAPSVYLGYVCVAVGCIALLICGTRGPKHSAEQAVPPNA